MNRPAGRTRAAVQAQRRTQAQRRASTRAALLEACLDCLLEQGYAGFTTAEVVRRAGVSRGAQAHHYATKAELVVAALRDVTGRLGAELAAETRGGRHSGRDAEPRLLDQLWAMHRDRAFPALMELWLAARTDQELRAELDGFERDLGRRTMAYCRRFAPDLAARADFRDLLVTWLATLRGLAVLGFLRPGEEIDRLWPTVRAQLRAMAADPPGTCDTADPPGARGQAGLPGQPGASPRSPGRHSSSPGHVSDLRSD